MSGKAGQKLNIFYKVKPVKQKPTTSGQSAEELSAIMYRSDSVADYLDKCRTSKTTVVFMGKI